MSFQAIVAALPPGELKKLVERIKKGDPKCPIPVDARVEKIKSEPGDKHKDGERATVKGSIYITDQPCYFIEYDNDPKDITTKWTPDMLIQSDDIGEDFMHIFIVGYRIRQI